MSDIAVIGLGALNKDHLYRVRYVLEDGETIVDEMVPTSGGSAANTIHGLAKLGVGTGFAGVVGDDGEGRTLLQDFGSVGVDTSQIRVKAGVKTGSVLCLSDRQGQRSLYVSPGANDALSMDDIDLDYINRAQWLHLSSFVGDRQLEISMELLDWLDKSVRVSFSPGALYVSKGLDVLSRMLKRARVLFLNQDEIQQLTGQSFDAGAETCLRQGCHIVVVTLGRGTSYRTALATSYIRDAGNEYVIEPISGDTVADSDTTGAGDAFAAGFIYGLINGKETEECGRLGSIVAQFSIARTGARTGLPTLEELSRRYRELYRQEI